MSELKFFDGQAHITASNEDPYPVKVMQDLQSANIVGTTRQVSVATTTTLIAPANPRRRSILITMITGTQIVYYGFTPLLVAGSGGYLHSSAGSSVTTYAKGEIYAIAITGAQTVSITEEVWAGA